MDARSPAKRFINSFAEEMGRWSARVVTIGLAFAGATLLEHIIY